MLHVWLSSLTFRLQQAATEGFRPSGHFLQYYSIAVYIRLLRKSLSLDLGDINVLWCSPQEI